jgi:hypothetical protein
MTARADMSSSLNQLRRAELTATCRLTAFPYLWRSAHVAPTRRSARISGLSLGTFVHRQAPQADICARKRWRRLTTPIDSAGRRRLSPIRLCLTGAAPTNLPSSTPSCAAPPSQRRSQLSYIGDRVIPSSLTIWPRVLVRDRERRADKKERRARGAADDRATLDAGDSAGTQK